MKTEKAIGLVVLVAAGGYLVWRFSPGLQAALRPPATGGLEPGNVNPRPPADGGKPAIAGSAPNLPGGVWTGVAAGVGALLTWAIVDRGLFRGGEEGVKVNPARDAFFLENFGSSDPQSCSEAIIHQLSTVQGIPWPQAEATRVRLMDRPDGILAADTMAEYTGAAKRIAAVFPGREILIPT